MTERDLVAGERARLPVWNAYKTGGKEYLYLNVDDPVRNDLSGPSSGLLNLEITFLSEEWSGKRKPEKFRLHLGPWPTGTELSSLGMEKA